jgi:hypothetical protein
MKVFKEEFPDKPHKEAMTWVRRPFFVLLSSSSLTLSLLFPDRREVGERRREPQEGSDKGAEEGAGEAWSQAQGRRGIQRG